MDLNRYIVMTCIVEAAAIAILCLMLRRRKAEAQQHLEALNAARRQEALGTLAGGIAHDFNNILASIVGFAALLQEDLRTMPESHEMARQVSIAAKRGQGIVAQLLGYSRRARNTEIARTPLSLDAVVRESIALLQPSIRSSTRITYDNTAPDTTVNGDAVQIGQAIVNLCINADHAIGARAGTIGILLDRVAVAHEFSDSDGLRVTIVDGGAVQLRNGSIGPGPCLRVTVSDNGAGMTRDVAAKIFDPFYTTKAAGEGTGLGLAAIEGIVLGHGGAIAVKTERFKGTSFALMFPAGSAGSAPAACPAEKASR